MRRSVSVYVTNIKQRLPLCLPYPTNGDIPTKTGTVFVYDWFFDEQSGLKYAPGVPDEKGSAGQKGQTTGVPQSVKGEVLEVSSESEYTDESSEKEVVLPAGDESLPWRKGHKGPRVTTKKALVTVPVHKSAPKPWNQEQIRLRKVSVEKKQVKSSQLEKVELKSHSVHDKDEARVIIDKVLGDKITSEEKEAHQDEEKEKPVPWLRGKKEKLVEEPEEKPEEKEKPVPWLRRKKEKAVEKEEEKPEEKEKPVPWLRGKKEKPVEKPEEKLDEKEKPVPWLRGKKEKGVEKEEETPEEKEKPVPWLRGKKAKPVEKPEDKIDRKVGQEKEENIVEDIPVIESIKKTKAKTVIGKALGKQFERDQGEEVEDKPLEKDSLKDKKPVLLLSSSVEQVEITPDDTTPKKVKPWTEENVALKKTEKVKKSEIVEGEIVEETEDKSKLKVGKTDKKYPWIETGESETLVPKDKAVKTLQDLESENIISPTVPAEQVTEQSAPVEKPSEEKGVPWKRGKPKDNVDKKPQVGVKEDQPWTKENVSLKKTTPVKKEVEKEKIASVELKPIKKTMPESVVEDSTILSKTTEVEIKEQVKVDKKTKEEKDKEEVPVAWKRGKKQDTRKEETLVKETEKIPVSDVYDSTISKNSEDKIEEEHVIDKKPKEEFKEDVPVLWQRGKKKPEKPKPETPQEISENDTSDSTLSRNTEEIDEKPKHKEDVPVTWKRGKKPDKTKEETLVETLPFETPQDYERPSLIKDVGIEETDNTLIKLKFTKKESIIVPEETIVQRADEIKHVQFDAKPKEIPEDLVVTPLTELPTEIKGIIKHVATEITPQDQTIPDLSDQTETDFNIKKPRPILEQKVPEKLILEKPELPWRKGKKEKIPRSESKTEIEIVRKKSIDLTNGLIQEEVTTQVGKKITKRRKISITKPYGNTNVLVEKEADIVEILDESVPLKELEYPKPVEEKSLKTVVTEIKEFLTKDIDGLNVLKKKTIQKKNRDGKYGKDEIYVIVEEPEFNQTDKPQEQKIIEATITRNAKGDSILKKKQITKTIKDGKEDFSILQLPDVLNIPEEKINKMKALEENIPELLSVDFDEIPVLNIEGVPKKIVTQVIDSVQHDKSGERISNKKKITKQYLNSGEEYTVVIEEPEKIDTVPVTKNLPELVSTESIQTVDFDDKGTKTIKEKKIVTKVINGNEEVIETPETIESVRTIEKRVSPLSENQPEDLKSETQVTITLDNKGGKHVKRKKIVKKVVNGKEEVVSVIEPLTNEIPEETAEPFVSEQAPEVRNVKETLTKDKGKRYKVRKEVVKTKDNLKEEIIVREEPRTEVPIAPGKINEIPEEVTTEVQEVITNDKDGKKVLKRSKKTKRVKDGRTETIEQPEVVEKPDVTTGSFPKEVNLKPVTASEIVPETVSVEVEETVVKDDKGGKRIKRVKKVRKISKTGQEEVITSEEPEVVEQPKPGLGVQYQTPEEVTTSTKDEFTTDDQGRKVVKRKKVTKKMKRGKEEVVEEPEIVELVDEKETPFEEAIPVCDVSEEQPEVIKTETQVIITKDNQGKKLVKRRKVVKKLVDGKEEVVSVVEPLTNEIPEETAEPFVSEQAPEVRNVKETLTKDKGKRYKVRKEVVKTKDNLKEEIIVREEPRTEVPIAPGKINEIPEEVTTEVQEVITNDKDGKKVLKRSKKTKRVKDGRTETIEQPEVVEKPDVTTGSFPKEVNLKPVTASEIVPETVSVEVEETVVKDDKGGKRIKRVKKVRKISKTGQEEVITSEEPEVVEQPKPGLGVQYQTPEEVTTSTKEEFTTDDQGRKVVKRKKVTKKMKRGKEEVVEEPEIVELVDEKETPFEEAIPVCDVSEEQPEVIKTETQVIITKDNQGKKLVKRRKVVKKLVDGKEEVVSVVEPLTNEIPEETAEPFVSEQAPEVRNVKETLTKDKGKRYKVRKEVVKTKDNLKEEIIVREEPRTEVPIAPGKINEIPEEVTTEVQEVITNDKDGKKVLKRSKKTKRVKDGRTETIEQPEVVEKPDVTTGSFPKVVNLKPVTASEIVPETVSVEVEETVVKDDKGGKRIKRVKKVRKISKTGQEEVITSEEPEVVEQPKPGLGVQYQTPEEVTTSTKDEFTNDDQGKKVVKRKKVTKKMKRGKEEVVEEPDTVEFLGDVVAPWDDVGKAKSAVTEDTKKKYPKVQDIEVLEDNRPEFDISHEDDVPDDVTEAEKVTLAMNILKIAEKKTEKQRKTFEDRMKTAEEESKSEGPFVPKEVVVLQKVPKRKKKLIPEQDISDLPDKELIRVDEVPEKADIVETHVSISEDNKGRRVVDRKRIVKKSEDGEQKIINIIHPFVEEIPEEKLEPFVSKDIPQARTIMEIEKQENGKKVSSRKTVVKKLVSGKEEIVVKDEPKIKEVFTPSEQTPGIVITKVQEVISEDKNGKKKVKREKEIKLVKEGKEEYYVQEPVEEELTDHQAETYFENENSKPILLEFYPEKVVIEEIKTLTTDEKGKPIIRKNKIIKKSLGDTEEVSVMDKPEIVEIFDSDLDEEIPEKESFEIQEVFSTDDKGRIHTKKKKVIKRFKKGKEEVTVIEEPDDDNTQPETEIEDSVQITELPSSKPEITSSLEQPETISLKKTKKPFKPTKENDLETVTLKPVKREKPESAEGKPVDDEVFELKPTTALPSETPLDKKDKVKKRGRWGKPDEQALDEFEPKEFEGNDDKQDRKKKKQKVPETKGEFSELEKPEDKPVLEEEEVRKLEDQPLEYETEEKEVDLSGEKKIRKKKKSKADLVKAEEEEVLQEDIPGSSEEKDLREKTKKKKKQPKIEERPIEDLASVRERLKPLKRDIVITEVKPTKVKIIPVSELPSFATLKLKKIPKKPEKEIKSVEVPKVLLKSRILRFDYPPMLHYCQYTELPEIFIDNGILSRNYLEAQQIKKTKRRKFKPTPVERQELEKFEPAEDLPLHKEKPIPEEVKKPREKPEKAQPEETEPRKLVMGKGKIPQDQDEQETVTLKKIPPKPKEGEKPAPENVDKPVLEKPLRSEPEDDESYKLKPVKPLPTGDSPELPAPEEKETPVPKEKKEASKKRPGRWAKPEKEEEVPEERKLELGKPKEKPEEPEDDIKLRYKQGPREEEQPEPIKLKPFKKEKPEDETKPKEPSVGKPKPFDYEREEEEIKPKEFEAPDDKKIKKKKKPKTPEVKDEVGELEKPEDKPEDEEKETVEVPEVEDRIEEHFEVDIDEKEIDTSEEKKLRKKRKPKADVVKEEEVPQEDIPESTQEKDLQDKPKKKRKPKADEKPVEDLASIKERLKPLKQDIVIMEIKPTKVKTIPVSDLPSFATLKLKKAPKRPEKEIKSVEVPKVLLKSRILRFHYPPMLHYCQYTDLPEIFIDNGILSRNYLEAQQIKKTKRRKFKPTPVERQELEKFEPAEDLPLHKEKPIPEEVKKPREKPEKAQPEETEPRKLVMGKGKIPQDQDEQETVTLKKIPPKPKEEEKPAPENVDKPVLEKPLRSEPEDDESYKLKSVKPLPTDDSPELPAPEEKETPAPKEKKEASKKRPGRWAKPEKEEEVPEERKLELGKPKEKPEEPEDDIKLRYKQGPREEEQPEPIKLKPFKKEKPEDETKPKEPSVGKPKPFDYEREKEEIKPKEFEAPDDKKIKKKKKPKTPEVKDEVGELEKPGDKPEDEEKETVEVPEVEDRIEEHFEVDIDEKEIDTSEEKKLRKKRKPKADVVKEEEVPQEDIPESTQEKDLQDKPKKKRKPKADEKPVEDLASIKERLKPLKQDIVIMEIKPTKVKTIPVSDLPSFATLKLKKAPKRPEKEIKSVEVPKVLLKSRILRFDYPPMLHYCQYTDLPEIFIDNGILSRNYLEAQQIKKTKRRKFKPTPVERQELEKFEPAEDLPLHKEKPIPEEVKKPREKPEKAQPEETEPRKLVMGKGKIPQDQDEQETVTLKKIPPKPKEEEKPAPENVDKPVLEKPLRSEPEDDESYKLKPVKPLPTDDSPELPAPEEKETPAPKEKKEASKKRPGRWAKPEKEEEVPEERKLELGKPKEKPEEPEDDIKLRYKQGPREEEQPEPIKLKPFKKEKPEDETKPKEPSVGKPKPFDYEREEEEIKPKEFEAPDDKKIKKKKKPKTPEVKDEVGELEKPEDKPEYEEKETGEVVEVKEKIEEPIPEEIEEKDVGLTEEKKIRKKKKTKVEVKEIEEVDKPVEKPEESVEEVKVEEKVTRVKKIKVKKGKVEKLDFDMTEVLAPRFIEKIQPVVSHQEQPALFTCKVEGHPKPTTSWQKDGIELHASEHFVITTFENVSTLEIINPTKEDIGVFSCKATNIGGVATCSANLIVLEKEESGEAPKFIKPLKPVIADTQAPATLRATVTGRPTPSIAWYRGQDEIIPDNEHTLEYLPDTGECVLSITEATPLDEAVYSVKAVNTFGRAECRANLVLRKATTIEKPRVLEAPTIVRPLQALLVPKDSTVTLEAEYTGVPNPEVKWFKNGKELVGEDIETKDNVTRLVIKKTTKKTTGKYEIRVVNEAGEARTSGSVTITGKTN
ncbi:hypothetical protein WDU94_000632 [Cyamophila willieti]